MAAPPPVLGLGVRATNAWVRVAIWGDLLDPRALPYLPPRAAFLTRPPQPPCIAPPAGAPPPQSSICRREAQQEEAAATSISATSIRASAAPPRCWKATCAPSPLGPSRTPLNSQRRPSSRPSPTKVSKPSQPPRLPLPFPQLIRDPQALGSQRRRWPEPAGAATLCFDLRKKECGYALRPLSFSVTLDPFLMFYQTCR
jgi:hypothetical protein